MRGCRHCRGRGLTAVAAAAAVVIVVVVVVGHGCRGGSGCSQLVMVVDGNAAQRWPLFGRVVARH